MYNNRRKRPGARRPAADGNRWIRLCAAAAVILVIGAAVAALVLNNRGAKGTEGAQEGVEIQIEQSGTAGDSVAPDNSQYPMDFSQYELQKDAVPEVNQLLGDYFQAKVDQDPAALYRVFGKTETDDLEKRREELAYEATVIEDYQDITCYTRQGLTEGSSYVVYVTYFVKYKKTDTLAPGLMWCYVVRQEDGSWIIRENVLGDEADYVAECNQSEDVKLLSSQVNQQLKEALESDSILAGYYKELRNGAMVQESDYDSSVSVMGETAPETSGPEESGQAESGGEQESGASQESAAPETEAQTGESGQEQAETQAGDTSQASEVKIGQ